MIEQIAEVPLFKCFLKWDKDKVWWGKGKLNTSGNHSEPEALGSGAFASFQ